MRYTISVVLFLICFLAAFGAAQDTSALPLPDPGNVTLTLAEYNRLGRRDQGDLQLQESIKKARLGRFPEPLDMPSAQPMA